MKRYRTWTVYTVALCSLLGLMLVPSLLAIRRGEQMYRDIRKIQEQYERNQGILDAMARKLFLTSITLREFLLDTSTENSRPYVQQLTANRADVQSRITELRRMIYTNPGDALGRLQQEVDGYWQSMGPVLEWSPEERAQRGTYFLRQEQRPRRQSIMAIADEIAELNRAFYRSQYDTLNRSEQQFRQDLQRTVYLAFLAGLIVAAASILRIAWLEKRALQQHEQVQRSGEELRQLSVQLRHAQEDERKNISRELHDEVGQQLTALRMELGGMERLRSADEQEFRERLGDVKLLTERSLRVVRDIAAGLHPSLLDDLGLGPALQKQARQFGKRTGTPVNVEFSGDLDKLPERHRIYVYRIVQESLTNCAKHASASSIAIRLHGTSEYLDLEVEDNGAGFQPDRVASGGLGLVGMEERVRELKGTMTIESKPGNGTRLSVRLPLNGRSA